jgi:acyl carrier protein
VQQLPERLPDFPRSRAVLVGTATYASAELPPIKPVVGNVGKLRQLLTDPAVSGFTDASCTASVDPPDREAVLDLLHAAARVAEDVLVFYFAGHGLLDTEDELYLAVVKSDPDRSFTSVAFRDVARIVTGSPARLKILILDCCFSGRAAMSAAAVPPNIDIDGTYVLTATAPTRRALFDDDATYTAFTGALIEIIEQGIDGAGELLTMADLFRAVRPAMARLNKPEPRSSSKDAAGQIALARNTRASATDVLLAERHRVRSLLNTTVQSLAALPAMLEHGSRRAVIADSGYEDLVNGANWAHSPTGFSADLVHTLAARGGSALADFLDRLVGTVALSAGRREALASLASQLRSVDGTTLQAAAVVSAPVDVMTEALAATERELQVMGPRYNRALYAARPVIEADFATFLDGPHTCFLVVSEAGRGKTNVLCRIAETYQDQRPTLLLTARFRVTGSDSLLKAVSSRFGYGTDWAMCFSVLATPGRTGMAPIILLDGINEVPSPPDVTLEALEALLIQCRRANVKIAVTCRKEFWPFFRSGLWQAYTGGADAGITNIRTLPPFTTDQIDDVVLAYFRWYRVSGALRAAAREMCRQPLVLRLLCEAYRDRDIGVVTELSLYPLLKLFWERKTAKVAELAGLRSSAAASTTLLDIAREMLRHNGVTISRDRLATALGWTADGMDRSDSLYSRVVDEEILVEESADAEAGVRFVGFAFDRLAEFAFALSIYVDGEWDTASREQIASHTARLMRAEEAFSSLRGALEFLVLRLEDRRRSDGIHYTVLAQMLAGGDRRWLQFATRLAFRLDPTADPGRFWDFVRTTLVPQKECLPRQLVAAEVGGHAEVFFDDVAGILDQLAHDRTLSVRHAAMQAIRGLPAATELRVIEAIGKRRGQITVDLLLRPIDGHAETTRDKLAWLIRHRARYGVVVMSARPSLTRPLDGLLETEELCHALASINDDQHNAAIARQWLGTLRAAAAEATEILTNDLVTITRLLLMLQLAGQAVTVAGDRLYVRAAQVADLRKRWNGLLRQGLWPTPDGRAFDELAAAATGNTAGDGSRSSALVLLDRACEGLPLPHPGEPLGYARSLTEQAAQLRLLHTVARVVWTIAWRHWDRGPSPSIPIDLLRDLTGRALTTGSPAGLDAPPGDAYEIRHQVNAILHDVSDVFGLPMSDVERRGLTSIGRLVIWCWQRVSAHEDGLLRLERVRREIAGASPAALAARLETLRRAPEDLDDFLRAACQELRNRPTDLASLWATYLSWPDDDRRACVDDQLDELHSRDYAAFWVLVQALLPRATGRVADVINSAIERVERVELAESDDRVVADLLEIMEEVLGADRADVRLVADLYDYIDSLSMVEFVVAIEEKFRIRIPDDEVAGIHKVQDMVDCIKRKQDGRR